MLTNRAISACILLGAFVALVVLLTPVSAHAAVDLDPIGNYILITIMQYVISMLDILQQVILWALGLISSALQSALEIDPSGGGAIIYTAWRTLRDLCNMAFIVALIMMSFGTIFNSLDIAGLSFLKPYSITGNGRGVIVNFLMAAILLNFSLAIGQTVVATSNKVSSIVVTLLPKNFGPQIAQSVGISEVANKKGTGFGVLSPNIPPETLTPGQYLEVKTWTPEKLALLQRCLKGELGTVGGTAGAKLKPGVRLDTPMGCFDAVRNGDPTTLDTLLSSLPSEEQIVNGVELALNNLPGGGGFAGTFATGIYNGYKTSQTKPTAKLATITGYIFSITMLSSLLISFITMILFLLVRLPAIWIMLALSPLAWTSLAFPGTDAFQKWWKNFWAWNLFSPLYLFVLYMAVLLLQNTNVAIASLGAKGSPFISSIGVAFQYLIAGIVINGGTALVLKASFLSGTIAGTWVGRLTGFTGVGGSAFAPAGRFATATGRGAAWAGGALANKTGATGVYRGVVGGISSEYEKRIAKTKETKDLNELSEAKTRASLFGDSAALEKLQRTRVQEATKKNEERGLSVKDMKDNFNKLVAAKDFGNPQYVALGQALIKEGALSPGQMKDFAANARTILGPTGGNAINQLVARKIAEQTKEKKYKDDKNYGTPAGTAAGAKSGADKAREYFSSLPDEKDQEKFLENLKKNQLAVYAQMASDPDVKALMLSKGIDVGANGQVMLGNEIIENNSSKLEAEDIPAAMKLAANQGWSLGAPGSNFAYRRDALLGDKKNISAMIDAAEPREKAEITQRIMDLAKDELKKKKQEAKIVARAQVKAQQRFGGGTPPTGGTTPPASGGGTPPPPTGPTAPRGGGGRTPPAPAPAAVPVPPPPAPATTTAPPRSARPSAVPVPATPPQPPGGGANAVRPPPSSGASGAAAPGGSKQKTLEVLIDGRPRGKIVVPEGAKDSDMERVVLQDPAFAAALQGKTIKRSMSGLGIFKITT